MLLTLGTNPCYSVAELDVTRKVTYNLFAPKHSSANSHGKFAKSMQHQSSESALWSRQGLLMRSSLSPDGLLEPNTKHGDTLQCNVWPVSVAAGSVVSVPILRKVVEGGTRRLHTNSQAQIVWKRVGLIVDGGSWVRSAVIRELHDAEAILKARLIRTTFVIHKHFVPVCSVDHGPA